MSTVSANSRSHEDGETGPAPTTVIDGAEYADDAGGTPPRIDGNPTLSGLSDDDFDDLYRQSWHAMVHLATLLTSSTAAAEDITQEAFAASYRRWPRMTDRAGAAAYIRTAVVNGTRSHHRRQRTRRLFLQSGAATDGAVVTTEGAMTEAAMTEALALRTAVAALPRRQREVVVLRYWLDLSEAEIARTLRVSPGTVKSSAARGLARLENVVRSTP